MPRRAEEADRWHGEPVAQEPPVPVVERVPGEPAALDPKRVLEQGTRRAAVQALAALDRLAALAEEGDPRYPRWWAQLETAAREIAHQSMLVKHGLSVKARPAPEKRT